MKVCCARIHMGAKIFLSENDPVPNLNHQVCYVLCGWSLTWQNFHRRKENGTTAPDTYLNGMAVTQVPHPNQQLNLILCHKQHNCNHAKQVYRYVILMTAFTVLLGTIALLLVPWLHHLWQLHHQEPPTTFPLGPPSQQCGINPIYSPISSWLRSLQGCVVMHIIHLQHGLQ